MKFTKKLFFLIFTIFTFLGFVVYATNTVANIRKSPKLPWQGVATAFDPAHNVGKNSVGENRFSQYGNNTITTDSVTGLMWQRISNDDVYYQCRTYDTEENTAEDTYCREETNQYRNACSQCAARAYCENLELGGFTDWRLPNIKEVQSITDLHSRYGLPSTDRFYFGEVNLWSSNTDPNNPAQGYLMSRAEIKRSEKWWGDKVTVKCVRCGNEGCTRTCQSGYKYNGVNCEKEYPTNTQVNVDGSVSNYLSDIAGGSTRFAFENGTSPGGTSIVVDKVTGLKWQSEGASQGTKSRTDALDYCANLSLGGYDDWRLPDFTELLSIVNFTINGYRGGKIGDPIDRDYFTIETYPLDQDYWSSTTNYLQSDGDRPYGFSFSSVYMALGYRHELKNVRCVR